MRFDLKLYFLSTKSQSQTHPKAWSYIFIPQLFYNINLVILRMMN
jgi:hypothetical protein